MAKVAVDVYGGDNAPEEIVKGCAQALREDRELKLVLAGKRDEIERLLSDYGADGTRVEILDASEVITNDDVPTVAIRRKADSSLVRALRATKEDPEICGMVSAGSTGAVLTGSLLIVGRIPKVMRPALAPVLPTIDRGHVLLIDCGANTDCKPEYLAQFAVMGSAYMRTMFGIESPRVALLSNGTEDKKGNELTHAAFGMISALPDIRFVGNMEARDVLSGEYDVVVSDGFYGNICLKSLEGTANTVFAALKQEIEGSFRAKLGALVMKPALRRMKHRLDYTRTGGACFVGCEKVVVKAHGSSKAVTIAAAIHQAKQSSDVNLSPVLAEALAKVDWEKLCRV